MARPADTMRRGEPRTGRAVWLRGNVAGPIGLFVVVVILGELLFATGWVSDLILPKPSEVATSTYELFESGLIFEHIAATLYETVAGFALAAVVAIAAAVAAASSAVLRNMVYPYAVTLQVMPMIALAPILIAVLGFGYSSKIVIAGLIAFFPIFVNTLTGLSRPDADAAELFRSLRATKMKTLGHLLLPTAAPYIFAGLRIGLTVALAGAVVAEFVSSQRGLGLLVQRFSYQLNMDDAFATILVLTGVGLLLFGAVVLADHAFVFWGRSRGLTARTRRQAKRIQRRLSQHTTSTSASGVPAGSDSGCGSNSGYSSDSGCGSNSGCGINDSSGPPAEEQWL